MGLAQALQGQAGVWALAADTDGIDGVEDNAGAFVGAGNAVAGPSLGMKIDQYLDRNDAYGYFRQLDDLVITGPTLHQRQRLPRDPGALRAHESFPPCWPSALT